MFAVPCLFQTAGVTSASIAVLARLLPLPMAPPSLSRKSSLQALIPLDGSERAEEAIVPAGQFVAALSAPGQGSLHLLRVVVMPATDLSSYGDREAISRAAPVARFLPL